MTCATMAPDEPWGGWAAQRARKRSRSAPGHPSGRPPVVSANRVEHPTAAASGIAGCGRRRELDLEGVVLKRAASRYRPGSRDWRKLNTEPGEPVHLPQLQEAMQARSDRQGRGGPHDMPNDERKARARLAAERRADRLSKDSHWTSAPAACGSDGPDGVDECRHDHGRCPPDAAGEPGTSTSYAELCEAHGLSRQLALVLAQGRGWVMRGGRG